MSMRISRFVVVILAIYLVACAPSRPTVENDVRVIESRPSVIQYTEQELQQARELFIKGVAAFEMEDYNEALDLLTMAYIKLPDHAGVNYSLADAYMFTGDFTNAAYYGKQAVDLEPDNRHYHLKLAEIYFRAGDGIQVAETLKAADKAVPNDPDILFFLATTLSDQSKYAESNDIYARLIRLQGNDLQLHFQRYRNYLMLEDETAALNELETIFELDPENPAVIQSLGAQYMEMDQPEKALRIYQKALENNPNQSEIKMAVADLYIQQNRWEEAGQLLMDVMKDETVQFRSKAELVQFLMARFVRDPENAVLRDRTADIVEFFAEENPEDAAAQALAADFFLSIEDYEMAKLKLFETVRLMPENEPAWRQLIQLMYSQSDFDAVIELRDEAEKHVPEDAFIRFFIGSSYTITGDNSQGIAWLKLATQAPARGAFKSIVYGSLGDAYYSEKRYDEAWSAYEQSITLDPDNATALNNYAYYLSVQEQHMEKAYEMSKKSLEFEPNNPSYLDTLGWIYFKKGNYDKAYEYISASIENGSMSATVYEHMGDVYEKLGDLSKAREWWGRSFDTDPDRVYLLERLELN